jgi:hypothetical protein
MANRGKILLVDYEAHTRRSAAMAGTILEAPQAETIIVGQLFAGLDATPGINPNTLAYDPRLTVRHTAMIEEAGRIPGHTAVNIVVLIERKEIGITSLEFGPLPQS